MKVFIERANRWKELSFEGTVAELLEKLELNPEAVLVARNNELVTAGEIVFQADEIKILSVVSGG